MVRDANGYSRRPAGTPEGGRFDHGDHHGGGDMDLTPPVTSNDMFDRFDDAGEVRDVNPKWPFCGGDPYPNVRPELNDEAARFDPADPEDARRADEWMDVADHDEAMMRFRAMLNALSKRNGLASSRTPPVMRRCLVSVLGNGETTPGPEPGRSLTEFCDWRIRSFIEARSGPTVCGSREMRSGMAVE